MPPKDIAPLWQKWVRVVTTAAPSPASEWAAGRWLQGQGWQILYHNIEIMHVQVDFLVRDPRCSLAIIEVKSQSALAHLPWRQKRRLFHVAEVLAAYEPVQLLLAQVSGKDVRLLPVDGLTV